VAISATSHIQIKAPNEDFLYQEMLNRVLLLDPAIAHPSESVMFRYFGDAGWSKPEFRIQARWIPTDNAYLIDAVDMQSNVLFAAEDLWMAGVRSDEDAWHRLPMRHAHTDTRRCPGALSPIEELQKTIIGHAQEFRPLEPSTDQVTIMVDGGFEYEASVTDADYATLMVSTTSAQSKIVHAAERLVKAVSVCTKVPLRNLEKN
jgi:hypothetical protein